MVEPIDEKAFKNPFNLFPRIAVWGKRASGVLSNTLIILVEKSMKNLARRWKRDERSVDDNDAFDFHGNFVGSLRRWCVVDDSIIDLVKRFVQRISSRLILFPLSSVTFFDGSLADQSHLTRLRLVGQTKPCEENLLRDNVRIETHISSLSWPLRSPHARAFRVRSVEREAWQQRAMSVSS